MKIKQQILDEFLKKIRMQVIDTCLLDFNDKGLCVDVMSLDSTHKAEAILHKTAFEEYEAVGKVGVDELNKLLLVFGRTGKVLDLKVEGNLLTVKGDSKTVEFELVDEKFIEVPEKLPPLTHTTTFNIEASKIQDILKDASLNKDVTIKISTVKDGAIITNTGKYKFTHNIDSEGTLSGENVLFGEPFRRVFEGVSNGDLICHIKSNYPMIAEHVTDKYEIKFLIAPRVED